MFKNNKKKNKHTITLDKSHKNIIKSFDKLDKTINTKKGKLQRLKSKLEKMEKKFNIENDDINEISRLKKEIEDLEKSIKDFEENDPKIDYFLNTSDILNNYYDEDAQPKQNNKEFLKFFGIKTEDNENNTDIEQEEQNSKTKKYNTKRRGSLSNEYFKIIDPDNFQENTKKNSLKCSECNIERVILQSQGLIVCENKECKLCGVAENIILDSKKASYKDPPPENSYYAYERKTHFNEILLQFQAKETTNINPEIFYLIEEELRKARIKNLANLSYDRIRKILKKIGHSKQYEHTPYIRYKLTGQPAPRFSSDIENKLILMFEMTQIPFEKVRAIVAPDRDNFLNYNYTLYKFLEILGLHDYTKFISLLKNRKLLVQQDKIWKGICKEIQDNYPEWKDIWVYYPTS